MGILETVVTPLVNAYNNTKKSYNKASRFNKTKASEILNKYSDFNVEYGLFKIDDDNKCSLNTEFNNFATEICIINNETFLKYRHNLNYLRYIIKRFSCFFSVQESSRILVTFSKFLNTTFILNLKIVDENILLVINIKTGLIQ